MREKALEYSHLACKTMMDKFETPELPPVYGFHYHAGIFLSGMMKLYEMCGDEKYLKYTMDWVDSVKRRTFTLQNCFFIYAFPKN